jgi:peptidoglycan hydrolase CwlO-like protein
LDQHLVWLENRVKNLDNEVQETQSQLQEIHSQLQQAKEKILEIENSKFWKLRNLWFKVKSMLYLTR